MPDAIEAIGSTTLAPTLPEVNLIPHPISAPDDTVALSIPAQAQLLEQQGFTLGEIAAQLGLPTAVAAEDLGIPVVNAPTTVAAV